MEIGPDFTDFESLRITTDNREKILDTFKKLTDWMYAYEVGSETLKPHFHIIFVKPPGYKQNTLRKHIMATFGSGNEVYSFKTDKSRNTIYKAGSYLAKGHDFEAFGRLKDHVDLFPKWVDPEKMKKKKDDEDDYSKPSKAKHYLLGYNNLVKQALRYRARFLAKKSESRDLSFVIAHMYCNSDWRLSATILKQGIPKTLYTEFEASVDHRMEAKFTKEYFNMMIRDDAHDNRDRW